MKMGWIGILIVLVAFIVGAVIGVSGDQWATDSCRVDCVTQEEQNRQFCEQIPQDHFNDAQTCYFEAYKLRNRCILGCNGWW